MKSSHEKTNHANYKLAATSGAEKSSQCEKCQKLRFLIRPLEVGSKSESFPMDHHVKMLIFTAEINTLAAGTKNSLVSVDNALHLLTVLDFEL